MRLPQFPQLVCRFIASPGKRFEALLAPTWSRRGFRHSLTPELPNGDPLEIPPPSLPDYPTDVPVPDPHDVPAWEPVDDPPPDPGEPQPKPRPIP